MNPAKPQQKRRQKDVMVGRKTADVTGLRRDMGQLQARCSKKADAGKGSRRTRHGLTAARRKLRLRGMDALDLRTATARALIAVKKALETDLGGLDSLSTQERMIVDSIARESALLGHYDAFLFAQKNVLGKRGRTLVKERGAIVDRLSRLLAQIGLKRRARKTIL